MEHLEIALPLIGGALMGLAASLLLWTHGKPAGIAGVYGGALDRGPDRGFRLSFLVGLVSSGFIAYALFPAAVSGGNGSPFGLVVVAAGRWNPSLMFVMAGAVGVHALLAPLVLRRARPLFAKDFAMPKNQRIDRDLIAGAAIFGVGWGLAGYCPGPALVSLPSHSMSVLAFACAMTVGMLLYRVARPAENRSATAALTPEVGPVQ